jgi:phage-related protein
MRIIVYGGTQEEMQRLLEDATKISGVEYDLSNYADIVDAIHVVQTEMGIAGATAEEASSTIEGSTNAMKASWQNLVVGIADGDQDLDELVNNFVDSVATVGENILPIIETAIGGVGSLIEQLLPIIMEAIPNIINSVLPSLLGSGVNMINTIIAGIQANLPQLTSSALAIVMQLASSLIAMLPQLLEIGLQMITQLMLGLSQSLPAMIPTIIEVVLNMVNILLDNLPLLIDAGLQLMIGLAIGIIEALPDIIDKLPQIITGIITALLNAIPQIAMAGIKLIGALIKNLPSIVSSIIRAVPTIINGIIGAFNNFIPTMTNIGLNLLQGIGNGISNGAGWLHDKVKNMCNTVLDEIKQFFGIHSPSTVMRDKVGIFLAKGLGEGFDDGLENEFSNGGLGNIKNMMNASFSPIQQQSLAYAGAGGGNMTSNVTVTLEGEARGLFKAVKKQNDMIYQSTGKKPLG